MFRPNDGSIFYKIRLNEWTSGLIDLRLVLCDRSVYLPDDLLLFVVVQFYQQISRGDPAYAVHVEVGHLCSFWRFDREYHSG